MRIFRVVTLVEKCLYCVFSYREVACSKVPAYLLFWLRHPFYELPGRFYLLFWMASYDPQASTTYWCSSKLNSLWFRKECCSELESVFLGSVHHQFHVRGRGDKHGNFLRNKELSCSCPVFFCCVDHKTLFRKCIPEFEEPERRFVVENCLCCSSRSSIFVVN